MLRRLKIRSKLVAVLLPPVAALAVLASIVVTPLLGDVRDARTISRYAELAATVNPLVNDLQLEGGLSAQALVGPNPAVVATLAEARTRTDASARTFVEAATSLVDVPAELESPLRDARAGVATLTVARTTVDGGAATPPEVWAAYNGSVEKLLEIHRGFLSGPALTDPALFRFTSALVELSLAKDALAQERAVLALSLVQGQVDRQTFGQINRLIGSYQDHIRRFEASAAPEELAAFRAAQGSADTEYTQSMESAVMAPAADGQPLAGDPVAFFNAMTTRLDGLRLVEAQAATRLRAEASAALSDARRDLITYAGGLALAVAAAVALAALVSRSLTEPVRRLTEAATEVANQRLPQLVEQLQSSDAPVDTNVVPISVRAGGEIGQLADAFNAVQQVAVHTAVEQAGLRRSIGAMFVNLGRRSQSLVDRQLELIDQLENNEKDPDSLDDLFALDHLATRMRRNAENLLVLAGQEPPRKWGRSLPLIDVIRAAVSEVEDYTRVDVQAEEDLYLVGHAATDLAHLVAELVENATAFSPPTSRVKVRVERAEQRYLVSVVDQGIGMTDADLTTTNQRLAGDVTNELALSNRIGFYVIGRLARRIGVAVRLGRSSSGGVIAQVALPAKLVSTTPDAGPAGSEMPDPLADSPQSARERLLGALRTSAPTGPVATPGAPAAPVVPAAPATPVAAGAAWGPVMAGPVDATGPVPARPAPAAERPAQPAVDPFLPARDQQNIGWGDEPEPEPTPPAPTIAPAPTDLPQRRGAGAVPPAPSAARPDLSDPPSVPMPPPADLPGRMPAPAGSGWEPPASVPPPPPAIHPALAGAAAALPQPGLSMDDRQTAADGLASLMGALGEGVTTAGLPQRQATRRSTPQVAAPPPPETPAPSRSADDVRSMLSKFRTGVERGRQLPDPTSAPTPEDRS